MARNTLLVGLAWFAAGNLLCGAATDLGTLVLAKLVEGVGKGMVIVLCRSLLYRQFDRIVIVAIGIYGVLAYATRPTTPLLTGAGERRAFLALDLLGERAAGHLGLPPGAALHQARPPAAALPLRIDWIGSHDVRAVGRVPGIHLWLVSQVGRMDVPHFHDNRPARPDSAGSPRGLGYAGLAVSEHFSRIFRVRIYVLAMSVRTLMLLQLLAVLTLMANYCLELRDYPRDITGWILAPASLTMTAATILTTWFHRRALRHVWLLIGVAGCAGCLWWMSSLDNFTSKEEVAFMIGCWGLFVGLFPPAFLQDEVEGLDRRDFLYGGALAIVALIVPMVVIPTMTGTIVSAWTDRALDAQRMNLQENRPEVQAASARIADYYRQHGVEAPDLPHVASTVLGTFVAKEAVAHGIQSGFHFLSLTVGSIGLLVTALLVRRPVTTPG